MTDAKDDHLGIFSSGKIENVGKDDWRFDLWTWDIPGQG
jgi:hypothetical protein